MATTDVHICNLTLSMLGDVGAITALDQQGSDPARRVGLHYPQAKSAALARRDWRFARRYAAASVVATQDSTPPIAVAHWAYAYAYPEKCVRVWGVVPPTWSPSAPDPTLRIPFEVGHFVSSSTEESAVVYCNQGEAVLRYTYDVSEAFMPAAFIDYLTAELARRLVVPLAKAKPSIMKSVADMLTMAWGVACTEDAASEFQADSEFTPSIARVRQ